MELKRIGRHFARNHRAPGVKRLRPIGKLSVMCQLAVKLRGFVRVGKARKLPSRAHMLPNVRKRLRVCSVVNVRTAERLPSAAQNIREFIQARSPMNVQHVGRLSPSGHTSPNIRKSTQARRPLCVQSVGGPSTLRGNLLSTS